jgi:hypothetical protein
MTQVGTGPARELGDHNLKYFQYFRLLGEVIDPNLTRLIGGCFAFETSLRNFTFYRGFQTEYATITIGET